MLRWFDVITVIFTFNDTVCNRTFTYNEFITNNILLGGESIKNVLNISGLFGGQ